MTDDERIEKVLSELEKIKPAMLDVSFFLTKQLNDEDDFSYRRVISTLESLRLARSTPDTPVLVLLSEGSKVANSGGYKKYIKELKRSEEEENRSRKTKIELDEVNLNLNRFYLKYKWLPFLFSGIAILISLAAIIISIVKS